MSLDIVSFQPSRELPLSSNGMSEPKNKNIISEFGGSNGEFLTLAPPAELSSSYIRRHCQEVPDFDALPYQVRHRNSELIQHFFLKNWYSAWIYNNNIKRFFWSEMYMRLHFAGKSSPLIPSHDLVL